MKTRNVVRGLLPGLLKKIGKTLAVLALGLTTVSCYGTITFDYSYTFGNGLVVSGSLDGDLNGDFVDNVANVSVFFNGTPMPGTVFTAKETGGGPYGFENGPVVSFDVFKNNFLFMNSDYANGDAGWNSYLVFYPSPGGSANARSDPLGHNTIDDPSVEDRWSLRESVAVPEPSTFIAGALLALPFGLQGFRWLRNRQQVA